MNTPIMIGAGLMALTTGVHVFAGGPEIMRPIRKADLPREVIATADVVWHGITVILALTAIGLAWLAFNTNPPLLWMLTGVQLGFAALFVGYGLTRLGNLTKMPQWIIFTGVPALTLWGAYA